MIRLEKFTKEKTKKNNNLTVVNNKNEFISAISDINSIKVNREIAVYFDADKKIFINTVHKTSFDKTAVGELKVLFVYKPENDYMFDKVTKLFGLTKENDVNLYSTNIINNFNFLIPTLIWDILLTRYSLESRNEEVFKTYPHKSKNGKVREITAPHQEIKESLQRLNPLLQTVYDGKTADFQVAYKKGKNVKSGAMIHVDKKYIFNIDLKDFYPSCKRELVKKYIDFLFAYSVNCDYIENEFLDTILKNDGLFIGSPISGTLANAIISGPAIFLKNICAKHDMTFSVYADDMTFGSDKPIKKKFIEGIFSAAFASYQLSEYFNINKKKSVGFTGCNRKITGVIINDSNLISVRRRYYRDIRVAIDHLSRGESNINVNKLRGKIAYATAIDESGKIIRYLNKYLNTVKQYNLCSEEKLAELNAKFGGK